MTREEAIIKLEGFSRERLWGCGEYSEALDMAIYVIKAVIDMEPTAQAIPIDDKTTNGDVLNKLFPNMMYGTNGEYYHVWSNDGKCTMNIHQDWWNARYIKEIFE